MYWSWVALAALCLALFARFTLPGEGYLTYFTDDFYYYQQVAQHLVWSGYSSFDGVHQTNGYHPLWLVLMTVLAAVFGGGTGFFLSVTLLIAALVVVTFHHYRRWLGQWFSRESATVGAWVGVAMFAVLARTGMEVALAACLLSVLYARLVARPVHFQSARELWVTGGLASLTFLARIDAVIPVLLVLALSLPAAVRASALGRWALWLTLGAVLAGGYLLLNWWVFSEVLPISGHAKQLKVGHGLSWAPLARLFGPDALNILFVWPAMLLGGWAMWSSRVRRDGGPARLVAWAAFLHPVVFFMVLSWRSDWPTWTWYLYPMPPILAIGVAALHARLVDHWRPLVLGRAVALCWLGAALVGMVKPNAEARAMYESAVDVARFAKTHPGVFAAGDRAGLLGYLLPDRVYQMEGLVGDHTLLANIQASRDLKQVLAEMGADYYVHGSVEFKPDGRCLALKEPALAGPHSPAMRSRFCESPVAEFRHGQLRTLIFKVNPTGGRG